VTAGFHAPMPPARTGVAAYAAEMLAELRKLGTVEAGATAADVHLYHIGNNGLHREIYQRALSHPGVVLLHDAVLHHLLLGTLSQTDYIAEFEYNYGAWHHGLAGDLWAGRGRAASGHHYFAYPMLRRLAERSLAVLVHNPGAAHMVRKHAPNAEIHEIPHPFSPPTHLPDAMDTARTRAQLGVGPNEVLFGLFGHLREAKRVQPVLRAFARLRNRRPNLKLLLAGAFASTDLERAVIPSPGVIRTGYLSESAFWRHAAAVDVCLSPRFPGAGETSGIAIRFMGLGKPVIVTRNEENSRFSADICLQGDAGAAEEAMYETMMDLLVAEPAVRQRLGRNAARYIAEQHSPGTTARLVWDVLRVHSIRKPL